MLVDLDDLGLLLLDGRVRSRVEAFLHVAAEVRRVVGVHAVVRLGADAFGVGEVLLSIAILGLRQLLAKLRHDLHCIIRWQDDGAALRSLRLRGLLRDDLRRLEALLRLSTLGLGRVLLLLHEVIVHLILHFGALFRAAQAVGLASRADRVESLGVTGVLAGGCLSVRWLVGHGAVRYLLVGEYLWLDLIEAAVGAVRQACDVADGAVADSAGTTGMRLELVAQAHGRLVGRKPSVLWWPRGRHDAHAPAVRVLAHVLAALLLWLACRRNTVLLHTHLALLLRVSSVASRSCPACARPVGIGATLLDTLRQIVAPLLPLVLRISLGECGLAVDLEGHLVLVVTLRRCMRRHTAMASQHGVGMLSGDRRPMVVGEVRLASPCVLLVVQWVAPANIDRLVLRPRRFAMLTGHSMH